ncbi:MAG: cytochrome oxidase subunit III [Alphaproteobacteria bacterium]|jgi:hypothetical protein
MNRKAFEIAGWIVFLLCAICFIITSVGSFWGMTGSLLFLLGCIFFLIPYVFPSKGDDE